MLYLHDYDPALSSGAKILQSEIVGDFTAITTSGTLSYSITNITSGSPTVQLPTAVGIAGQQFVIKNSGAGTPVVSTTGGQTIDGASTFSLGTQYQSLTVVSNGVNWIII